MPKETIELLVDGGKATATPTMNQQIGPMGINVQNVLKEINKKTEMFTNMKVPAKVIVDTTSKTFEVEIGTPPTTALIKKELALQKGASEPDKNKLGNLGIEQVIKIAKMKQDSMLANDFKAVVKSVIGTCGSMGVLVEGLEPKGAVVNVNLGVYDQLINEGRTTISEDKKEALEKGLKDVQERIAKELAKLAKAKEVKKEVTEEAVEEAEAPKETKEGKEAKEAKPAKEVKEAVKPSKEAKKEEKKK